MQFYIYSELPINEIKNYIDTYLNFSKYMFLTNIQVNKIFKEYYPNINVNTFYNYLINNIRYVRDKREVKLYWNNYIDINNYNFNNIIQLLEFGNLKVLPLHIISKLLIEAIKYYNISNYYEVYF